MFLNDCFIVEKEVINIFKGCGKVIVAMQGMMMMTRMQLLDFWILYSHGLSKMFSTKISIETRFFSHSPFNSNNENLQLSLEKDLVLDKHESALII